MKNSFFRSYEGRRRFVLPSRLGRVVWYGAAGLAALALGAAGLICIYSLASFFISGRITSAAAYMWPLLLVAVVAGLIVWLVSHHTLYWHEEVASGVVTGKGGHNDRYFHVLGKNRAGEVCETLMVPRLPGEFDSTEIGEVIDRR